MHRLHLSRHALPAVLAVVVALLAPLLAGGGTVTATAGSAVARAAVNERVTAVAAPDVRFAINGEAMTVARQIAEQHWGTSACNGAVNLVWTQLDDDTNATAAWRNPTDAWNNAAENFDCTIEFNARSDFDWPKLCTVMTHEIGHLVGNQHADAPGQLMSPIYAEPLPACAGDEPGAPPAPAAAEPVEEELVDDGEPVALSADAKRATKKPLSASKKTKRAKTSKRCARRFSATRRTTRCAKASRKVGRAARARH